MESRDETVAELLAREPRAVGILLGHGMHCVGCAIAPFETLAEVCAIYKVPLKQLLEELRGAGGPRMRRTSSSVAANEPGDVVDEASHDSFPASDPPGWTLGVERK